MSERADRIILISPTISKKNLKDYSSRSNLIMYVQYYKEKIHLCIVLRTEI